MHFHESMHAAVQLHGTQTAVDFRNHEIVMGDMDIVGRLRKNILHDENIVLRSVVEKHNSVVATA